MLAPKISSYGDSIRIAVIRADIVMEIRRENNDITVCQKIFDTIKGNVSVQPTTIFI